VSLDAKTLKICSAAKADDLNEVAKAIADSLGKPLVVQPYDYDC
jgi:hypothetical protein